MNKRIKKKQLNKSLVSKRLIKLVRRYTNVHCSVDMCCGIFGVSSMSFDSDGFGMEFTPQMSEKSYRAIENLCRQLFLETKKLIDDDCDDSDWGNYWDIQYGYRIVNKAVGTYQPRYDEQNKILGYYVDQRCIWEDAYEGSIYIPIKENKFLAFDYKC